MTKVCCRCQLDQPLSQFDKNRSSTDGRARACKSCSHQISQTHRHKMANRPKLVPSTKICSSCTEELPATHFFTRKWSIDGLTTWCKSCDRVYHKKRRDTNPEKTKQEAREYHHIPEVKERHRQNQAKYAKSAKGKSTKHAHEANPEVQNLIKIKNKRRQLTPEGKFTTHRAHSKSRGIGWRLTLNDFEQLWQKPCCYCGSSIATIGLDRVDSALDYTLDNVVPCCSACNFAKRDRSVQVFLDHCAQVVAHQQSLQNSQAN